MFGSLFKSKNKRFYELVIMSLHKPTTGEGGGIQSFTFNEACEYGYMNVARNAYEELNEEEVRFTYSPHLANKKDSKIYIVTLKRTSNGLAEFDSSVNPVSNY